MPLNCDQLLEVASTISMNENLRVTVNEAFKGGIMAGVGAFAGGLVCGPPGIAIGAAVGGVAGAYWSSGKFKSVPQLISELPKNQRSHLAAQIENAFRDINIYDVAALVTFVMANDSLKMVVIKIVRDYIVNELKMQIVD